MLPLVVTTRLGVKFANRPLLDPAALEGRIELLRHTSARCLAQLAPIKPTWVLQTHPEHVDQLESALRRGKVISKPDGVTVQVIARSEDGFHPMALERLDVPDRFLCLRLDSDDYYFPRSLAKALDRFSAEPAGTLVDFPRGFLVELASGQAKRFGYPVQGPFYGVVATPDDPLPAVGTHGRARDGRRCVELLERSWIQTVNDSNDSTRYGRAGRVHEARGMIGQMRRARGHRPLHQLALRPLDLLPVAPWQTGSLVRTVTQR